MAQEPEPHRTIWRIGSWVAVRGWLGLVLAGIGVVLLWLGWYRISGETLVAAQVPYLASASIPGGALLIAGMVLVGSELTRRGSDETEQMVTTLYRLLTEEEAEPTPTPTSAAKPDRMDDDTLVALPDGTKYHRTTCLLVEGKADMQTVTTEDIAGRHLEPCPVCSPITP